MWACVYMKANIKDLSARWVQVYYSLYSLRRVSSKREFCQAVGMQPQNFRPIENGSRSISMPMLIATINAYNVSPDWLFLGAGNMLSEYGDRSL